MPALVAVDEAHCTSQWGHDFRPDYRMLGERMPLLRPAPVIAPIAARSGTRAGAGHGSAMWSTARGVLSA